MTGIVEVTAPRILSDPGAPSLLSRCGDRLSVSFRQRRTRQNTRAPETSWPGSATTGAIPRGASGRHFASVVGIGAGYDVRSSGPRSRQGRCAGASGGRPSFVRTPGYGSGRPAVCQALIASTGCTSMMMFKARLSRTHRAVPASIAMMTRTVTQSLRLFAAPDVALPESEPPIRAERQPSHPQFRACGDDEHCQGP